jgi:hypothetical protein
VPAIGFGLLWSGYTLMFWGWCKVKGYDITLGEIVIPKHFTGTWPPPLVKDTADQQPKVNPKDHPGDQPWTWQNDPNYGATISNKGSSTSGGSVIQV